MSTEPFVGGYPAPSNIGASGVWSAKTVQLYSGGSAWPQPTKGFWTFIGDADNTSAGGANDLYSEGGLFQTAAQVSAGNNEYYVIGRWINQSGMTGSGVGIFKGLRINGDEAPSGTIGVSKYYNWSLSNGIHFGQCGDIFVENPGGPWHYIVMAGYTGSSYQYSHSRIVKLNDSEAEQTSFSLRTSNGGPHGVKQPILVRWNSQLYQIAHGHQYQNGQYKREILVARINESTLDRTTPAMRLYHSAWGYTYYQMTGKIIANHKTDASGNTLNVTFDGYHQTPAGGSGNNVIMLGQWTTGGSISYNHSNDYFIWNNSSSKDLYLTDTETDGDVFWITGYGIANSVVSGTRNFAAIMKRTYQASSMADNGTWILKLQTGGYNQSTHITSIALDSSNNKLYFHGYADGIGGSTDNSTFIGRIDVTNPTWVLDWCNAYVNTGFSNYPGWGRNKLILTANDTITSYGYTQVAEGGGVNPVVAQLITVPRDGSSKGGAGGNDGQTLSSHDIKDKCLFQLESASTNVTITNANSGPGINMYNSNEYSNPTQGTTNYNNTDPSPVLYKSGGV
tara:strand:- start:2903 stop:4594 length:1692 start_codon:yes stop_codon:yes gene_type:complete